ncbi:MAG TPA: cytochrome P450, partial [Longimicrobiales bacterium]|nr:cytochrome P450 [Longimicrobiales bacterium]
SYAETMVEHTEAMLENWGDGDVRDVHQDMMAVTLKIVAKVLFNADVDQDIAAVHDSFDSVTKEIAARFRRPVFIPDWVPIPGNLRYRDGVKKLNALVFRIIREHHANGADGSDLLSMLMQVRDEQGNAMSDEQLRDEAVTLLLAGHETTALALSWAFYLLSLHPDVEAQLAEELQVALDGRSPSMIDLSKLRYTEAVILETMRVFPPAYGIGREAVNDCKVGGYDVPAGTTLFMSAWVVHRDPRFYDQPDEFKPERWLDGLADRLPRHAYMPFGGGPRICIGNNFAMMEAILLLATIAQRYRLEKVSDRPVEPFPSITLRPNGGVHLRLQKRLAAVATSLS